MIFVAPFTDFSYELGIIDLALEGPIERSNSDKGRSLVSAGIGPDFVVDSHKVIHSSFVCQSILINERRRLASPKPVAQNKIYDKQIK